MNRDAICARLPHAGRMCLLDHLESWDEQSITCLAGSHRSADNPLRSHDRLHAVCGVEYAAQAMALHGRLLARPDTQPAVGYLASVRDLKLEIEDLSAVPDDLRIVARRLSGDANGFIYEFEIVAATHTLLSGRVAVRLMTGGGVA
jgi:predicted hotdog family 3-hydroxylacyl-ACP dehydratase